MLFFAGSEVNDPCTLLSYTIMNASTLHMAVRYDLVLTEVDLVEKRTQAATEEWKRIEIDALERRALVAEEGWRKAEALERRALAAEEGWRNAEVARHAWSIAAMERGWRPSSSSSNSMEQQPQAQVIKAEGDSVELQALVLQAPSVKAKEEVVPRALAINDEIEKEVPQSTYQTPKEAQASSCGKSTQR